MTVSELILETAIKEAGDVCDVRLEKAFAEDLLEILREYNTIHGCLKEKCCICPHCRDCDVDEKGKIKSGQDAQTIGGWISVKDRLPEIDERVLVFGVGKYDCFIGTSQIAITHMSDRNLIDCHRKTQPYWIAPWQYFLTDYEITHWMPLPSTEGLDET